MKLETTYHLDTSQSLIAFMADYTNAGKFATRCIRTRNQISNHYDVTEISSKKSAIRTTTIKGKRLVPIIQEDKTTSTSTSPSRPKFSFGKFLAKAFLTTVNGDWYGFDEEYKITYNSTNVEESVRLYLTPTPLFFNIKRTYQKVGLYIEIISETRSNALIGVKLMPKIIEKRFFDVVSRDYESRLKLMGNLTIVSSSYI